MLLQKIFTPDRIKIGLESTDKDELFEEMVDTISRSEGRQFPSATVLSALHERENKMSTGIKKGIALPHCKTDAIDGLIGAIGLSRTGIEYESLDGEPVFLVCMIISSNKETEMHLQALKGLAEILNDSEYCKELFAADTPEKVFNILKEFESMDN